MAPLQTGNRTDLRLAVVSVAQALPAWAQACCDWKKERAGFSVADNGFLQSTDTSDQHDGIIRLDMAQSRGPVL